MPPDLRLIAPQIDLLEREIRKSIYAKSTQANPQRVLEKTFGVLDKDGSGEVSIDEFVGAMERFGLHVQGLRPGLGGLSMKVVQALFDQYDSDGSVIRARYSRDHAEMRGRDAASSRRHLGRISGIPRRARCLTRSSAPSSLRSRTSRRRRCDSPPRDTPRYTRDTPEMCRRR